MKVFLVLPSFLSLALAMDHLIQVLRGDVPVYLADVFYPPTMTFLAWIPSTNESQEWCSKAVDASDDALFSLENMQNLQIHDYFQDQAYVTWDGRRFLDCVVTPDSVSLEFCQGIVNRSKNGGWKYLGAGFKKWTCWVKQEAEKIDEVEETNFSGYQNFHTMTIRGSEETLTIPTIENTGTAARNSATSAVTARVAM